MNDSTPNPERLQSLQNVILIEQAQVQGHLGGLVRQSVEDTLNALLDEEANQICQAERYERSPDRVDTRAGHYNRK